VWGTDNTTALNTLIASPGVVNPLFYFPSNDDAYYSDGGHVFPDDYSGMRGDGLLETRVITTHLTSTMFKSTGLWSHFDDFSVDHGSFFTPYNKTAPTSGSALEMYDAAGNYLMNQVLVKVLNTTERDALSTSVKQAYITATGDVYVRDSANAWQTYTNGDWISYTPTWTAATTNPTVGNGTLQGWYSLNGKTCSVRIHLTMGSTTTYGSGSYRWDLPFTSVGILAGAGNTIGTGNVYDTSGGSRTIMFAYQGGNTYVQLATSGSVLVAPASPFTFANGDSVSINLSFEVD